ncbi:DUF5018 domain-containing protein [Spirosoma sp.]|uniref:DUF5018 domain-containing protein n=1 Tax=Spirosoma sp. TaxID=1899569 RepID=UPI003B3A78DA
MRQIPVHRIACLGLLLLGLVSCKKTEPDVTPGGTTTPGSNTSTSATTKSSAKDILGFEFSTLNPVVKAVIEATAKTIAATVPANIDLTKLAPSISLPPKATISPGSGVAQDFSKVVTYTVTAEDGSTQAYAVTVSKMPATSSVCRVVAIVGTSNTGGSKSTYQFDSQNRLSQIKIENTNAGGAVLSSNTTVYTYNADGFVTRSVRSYWYATPANSNTKELTTNYTYQNGRMVKNELITTTVGGAISSSTTQYEYDVQGNVSKRITSSGSLQETTTFANGAVTAITSNQATYTLNAQGFVTKRVSTNGTSNVYQYNAAGQNTVIESYNAQSVKTGYTTYQNVDKELNTPTNPLGFKGHPTTVPALYGNNGLTAKQISYIIDATGKETKTNEYIWMYQGDSRGNVTSYTSTTSFLSGTSMVNNTATYTYEYAGCQ